ncbi:DUF4440 domain-containing protein [Pseudaminobacter sp. NGMCC 1.201702]|uniref:DUF4440 domain-containing protein n=1 Tax=Pseudaminobacter sp. NGMCC 1.201702 TaxID=3391825 RepID=UPI0039EF152C
MTGKRIAASLFLLALLTALPSRASDSDLIEQWYAAVLAVDLDELANLLADDASITLDDLGVTQSKSEFIASMDEWETASEGATIRHRIEADQGDTTTVLACYDFPANDILMRETFVISDGRIAGNRQATVAETCDSY